MSILSEEPELPEPEPGDADMFRPSPNVMSPHGPWGGYPEPGPLGFRDDGLCPLARNT